MLKEYARTKGEIIVVENPTKDQDYSPYDPRSTWNNDRYYTWRPYRPYYRRYWQPRYDYRQPSIPPIVINNGRPDSFLAFLDRVKVVAITLIAAPIILVELAMFLDFLRPH